MTFRCKQLLLGEIQIINLILENVFSSLIKMITEAYFKLTGLVLAKPEKRKRDNIP